VDVLRERLGVEAQLERGHGGVFEVSVNGRVVSRKGPMGFPMPDEIVEAVRTALHDQPGT
jgi:selenoprotein W-related protein